MWISRYNQEMVVMTLTRQARKLTYSKFKFKNEMRSLPSLRRNFIKNKRKHHEKFISMINQLDKANKIEETFSSHLEQRHKILNKLEAKIGQYKEEVSSLRSHLEETKKQPQGAETMMEDLELIDGQLDYVEKE